jgi:hypothetical protein
MLIEDMEREEDHRKRAEYEKPLKFKLLKFISNFMERFNN